MADETLPDDQARQKREAAAATQIQRAWRKKQKERPSHLKLSPEQRWDAAAEAAKTKVRVSLSLQ